MSENNSQDGSFRINPRYAFWQMAKALTTGEQHADPATRSRAQERASKWEQVFRGILDGTLEVGSRTPLSDVPAWATLEVVTGGFATGQLLAGGPLLAHERDLLAQEPMLAGEDGRTLLNAYYLSERGLADLRERLHSGHYEIDVPEEGALLVVTWLVEQGHAEAARSLLAEIGPYFHQLRFYPRATDRPLHSGSQVFLESVGSTVRSLERIEAGANILAQKEAIEVWAPLYDEVVRLLLETVAGTPPHFEVGTDGKPLPEIQGQLRVEGGWPCSLYPNGWAVRAQRVLDEYRDLRQIFSLTAKPEQKAQTFAQLRHYLQQMVSDPLAIRAAGVRRLRVLLARYRHKYGLPGSEQHHEYRRKQARQVDIPLYPEIAQMVIARLAAYDQTSGIPDLEPVLLPASSEETQGRQVKPQTTIPAKIKRKMQRSLMDSVDQLVGRGIISSADTLARVLPQITSEIRAAGIADGTLRPLYAAIYRAFRRRRSLLLLNLENQVRIEELPWVAAIEEFRQENLSTREVARQTLEEVATLALTSFPYAILPNKLLQELVALAKGAGLAIPFVEEVAADIFMNTFSPKFVAAAKRASELLDGSLYARYYGIDVREVRRLSDAPASRGSRQVNPADATFVALCTRRAGVDPAGRWSVAANGMVIEQQQILTTQNLAVLFHTFGLAAKLRGQLAQMARRCFEWVCAHQQMTVYDWHGRLISVKNSAYAWRQMIFFLSFLPDAEVQAFLAWAQAFFQRQNADFVARFGPAMNGLVAAVEGYALDAPRDDARPIKRFLGWSQHRHWLLE